MIVEPIIGPSARKRGLRDEDILHAFRNPIDVVDVGDGMTMFVGADLAGKLLEIGFFEAEEDEPVVIVHAMPARSKYLR